jgi:hypothetical protein
MSMNEQTYVLKGGKYISLLVYVVYGMLREVIAPDPGYILCS